MSLARQGARHLLAHCGSATANDRIVVIFDASTRPVAQCMAEAASELNLRINLVETPVAATHGEEPGRKAASAMAQATLILGLRAKSMAHTHARIEARRARYLSLPDYSLELLSDPSLNIDYHSLLPGVRAFADKMTSGHRIVVTSAAGSNLRLDITGRTGNCCPGFVALAGELGSPPDVEANIAPLEDYSEGILVVDGSIPFPGYGLLDVPVTLRIERGRIVSIEGGVGDLSRRLSALFDMYGPDRPRILAECGVGLNPAACLSGTMLTDEGTLGTLHCGFGSNHTVGGTNVVGFHLDFVIREPTMSIDDKVIIDQGQIIR